jgi:hypothetical protein
MKKCPQCQNLFDDENLFCLNDGTPLNDEPAPTVAFDVPPKYQASPFVVDISPKQETPTQVNPFPFQRDTTSPQRDSKNYVVVLLIGLLLGGILVVAAFLLLRGSGEKAITTGNTSQNKNPLHNIETPTANPDGITEDKNKNVVDRDTNANEKSKNNNKKYNGRVIMLNAYVRSAPDQYAPEVDILPMDDRLILGKRASPNSPWYRVTCEHGTKGWIHGNTVEFTK